MNCHDLTELLLDFLNGELPEDFFCPHITEHWQMSALCHFIWKPIRSPFS